MRIGDNPNKFSGEQVKHYAHQVIIPVYILDEEGYFKDSFTIFQLCLQSLLVTTHSNTYITIVNNGSGKKVVDYLNGLAAENKIQEVIHTTNIGKINAVLKGIVGVRADIVTISDQDILFKENWQSATFDVFNSFENVGVVGLIPMFTSYKSYSAPIIFDFLFSKRLGFTAVKNRDDMVRFYDSIWIGRPYDPKALETYLTLKAENGTYAVVGSGHVVASYRKSVFDSLNRSFTNDLLSGVSDRDYLDLPPLKLGYYRLTTHDNYAYHMGNGFENWMQQFYESIAGKAKPAAVQLLKSIQRKQTFFLKLNYYFKKATVHKIIFRAIFLKIFVQQKAFLK
ncbi:glycosyltransferase family 2 protein [Flavobacterium sp.]|uniref:glycosyltransferase family A protein n=1 Tax=Flavobacterium sp. TaxID=239 RepID=UPI00286DEA7D|nr:glycosyltransferase family 2 protein [Flavobacterium sp.]